MQKILEFCEKCLNVANKAADNAETDTRLNMNIGAMLSYSSVIELVKKEMEKEMEKDSELIGLLAGWENYAERMMQKWPNGLEKVEGHRYREAVSDLATAATLEMVVSDLRKCLDCHECDGK